MTVQANFIKDPALQNCLEVADRTRHLCHEIVTTLENATDGGQSDQARIEQSRKQKNLSALVVQLKALHRAAIMLPRDAKEATNEARRDVDRLHLQLQNLHYEQRHLRGKITACREFQ